MTPPEQTRIPPRPPIRSNLNDNLSSKRPTDNCAPIKPGNPWKGSGHSGEPSKPTHGSSSRSAKPRHKRDLHLAVSNNNEEAWSRSLDHALQYCRHTFSPEVWSRVRNDVRRICETGKRQSRDQGISRDQEKVASREKEKRGRETKAREYSKLRKMLGSRATSRNGQGKYDSMVIHR